MYNPVIFREYDIRGVINKDLDESFARELGRAFAAFVKTERKVESPMVTVGRDARLTGPGLQGALVEGLLESGCRVLQLGLITTPMSYFSMFHLGADGGVMVTGSHNPPEYNGFKISLGRSTLAGSQIQELARIVKEKEYSVTHRGSLEDYDISTPYLLKHLNEFEGLSEVPLVLDCGNGAAGCIARKFYEQAQQKPLILFEKPDGNFPNHHPDPTVEENLVDLKEAIKVHRARIGIGFDGDADRIVIVDENGRSLLGDELMVIVSRDLLKKTPGAKIIGDVKCSDRLYNDIAENGGQPIMWKTGHSLIKGKIKEEKAPFGGELSGHIFFADRNYGYDDALYAGLRIVEIMAKTGKSLSELLEGLPPSFSTPEIRLDTTEEKKVSIVEKLKKTFSEPSDEYKVNLLDGVRISFDDGWALVRSSNTQPVLVMRFESSTEEGLARIRQRVESEVLPGL